LAGQLVALLPVFAPALTVALTGHHYWPGAFAADIPRSQRDGDYSLAVLDTFGLVFETSRVHKHRTP
jgi:hypothetical protein